MDISIKKLGHQDLDLLTRLIGIYDKVFEMKGFKMPDTDYLQKLLKKDHVFFFVALSDGLVLGGLTAHILPSVYFTSGEVYLYDLAVKTEYQRKGIGKQLLLSLQKYCSEIGMKEVFVQADLEDQHALDFYRSTNGNPESVVHFTYPLTVSKN